MKKFFIVLLVLVLVAGSFLLYAGNMFYPLLFPQRAGVEFNYDMEPVEVKMRNVTLKIPEAYLYRKLEWRDDGTVYTPIGLRASWKDDLKPWTLSESFKKRDKSAGATIFIHGHKSLDYVEKKIKGILQLMKRAYPQRYDEVDKGIYKGIFHRYNVLTKVKKRNPEGIASIILLPVKKTEKPYWISCPKSSKPDNRRCTIRTYADNNIYFDLRMPFQEIEFYEEKTEKVRNLINQFIIKEGK